VEDGGSGRGFNYWFDFDYSFINITHDKYNLSGLDRTEYKHINLVTIYFIDFNIRKEKYQYNYIHN
jgi:hypothetical protein